MQVSNSLLHRCKPAGLGWPSSAGPAPTFVTLYVVSMCICSFGASLPPAPEQIPKVGRYVLFIAKSWLHKARAQFVHWDFGSGSCSVSRLLDTCQGAHTLTRMWLHQTCWCPLARGTCDPLYLLSYVALSSMLCVIEESSRAACLDRSGASSSTEGGASPLLT